MSKSNLPPLTVAPSAMLLNPKLSLRQLRVLIALATYRNKKTRLCNPSHETLAEETGIAIRHVREALKQLKELKIIKWKTVRRGNRNGANKYEIPEMDKFDTAQIGEGQTSETKTNCAIESPNASSDPAQSGHSTLPDSDNLTLPKSVRGTEKRRTENRTENSTAILGKSLDDLNFPPETRTLGQRLRSVEQQRWINFWPTPDVLKEYEEELLEIISECHRIGTSSDNGKTCQSMNDVGYRAGEIYCEITEEENNPYLDLTGGIDR
jgi:hypothetical protein